MADLVVTVPLPGWEAWLQEGDLAGEPWSGAYWAWKGSGKIPPIERTDRLYIVSHGKLRGWAPVLELRLGPIKPRAYIWGRDVPTWEIVRTCKAKAVTIAEPIRGFQSWRRRWWSYGDELPFPDWRTP